MMLNIPNVHELKIEKRYFDEQQIGRKNFEIRKDDRSPRFEVGDKLTLREYVKGEYTGRVLTRRITYILRGEYCPKGYCIMSTAPFETSSGKQRPIDANAVKSQIQALKKSPWYCRFPSRDKKDALDIIEACIDSAATVKAEAKQKEMAGEEAEKALKE